MSSGQESQIINKYRALLNPMTTKKIIKKIFKILLLIVLIFSSLYITNKVREQFPSIRIQSKDITSFSSNGTEYHFGQNYSDIFFKSELHNLCSKQYEFSHISSWVYNLDDSSIREGDPVLISSNVETDADQLNDTEHLAGIDKNNLKRIHKGITSLDLIYFSRKNITVYLLSCYNAEDLTPTNTVFRINLTRPSFVDTKIGSFIVFITVFVLLSQFFEQTIKFFSK